MSDKFIVDIKDFQSLKKVHLDLPKGVTIITGKTNEGKSSVFRAIDSALFNLGDDSMIRGGQRYYGVSIDNGSHKMVFMRDGNGKNEKSAYQFDDGTVQKKVGRTQLQEVADNFNIRDVRMQNGSKMKINFWYQNDKPFLTDKTSGQLYEFLSLSSCDKYSRVLKTMKADEKALESSINSITAEIDTLKIINNKKQDFIDSNKGFDDVYLKTVTLSQENHKLQDLDNLLKDIDSLSDKIGESKKRLKKIIEKFNKIPIDTLSEKFNIIADSYRDIESDIKSANGLEKLNDSIGDMKIELKNKKTVSDNSSLMEKDISQRLDLLIADNDLVSYLLQIQSGSVDTNNNINDLKVRIVSIENKLFADENNVKDRIQKADEDNSFVFDMISRIGSIKNIKDSIVSVKEKLKINKDSIKKNDEDLEDLKKEAGYCPFCGTVFSK